MKKTVLTLSFLAIFSSNAYASKPLSAEEQQYIKEIMEDQFRDPDSAKYRFPDYIESSQNYCFKVNATNAFGGYVGYKWMQIPFDVIMKKQPHKPALLAYLPDGIFDDICKEMGYK